MKQVLLVIVAAIILMAYLAGQSSNQQAAQNENSPQWDSAIKALQQEQKIKDVHRKGSTLYIGVIDNGNDRSGYAQYVCQVLAEHNVQHGITVNIMDIVKLSQQNQWDKIGSHRC